MYFKLKSVQIMFLLQQIQSRGWHSDHEKEHTAYTGINSQAFKSSLEQAVKAIEELNQVKLKMHLNDE